MSPSRLKSRMHCLARVTLKRVAIATHSVKIFACESRKPIDLADPRDRVLRILKAQPA
jgi:hypothetical protein